MTQTAPKKRTVSAPAWALTAQENNSLEGYQPMTITASIETITKPIAQQLLDSQVLNRPVNWTLVETYRNEMDAGRWHTNGEAIKIDWNDHMSDGQHRCHGLLRSNLDSFVTIVVRGLDPMAQMTMDAGARRQAGQQLAMRGVKDSNVVAAGVRTYLLYSTGLMFRDTNASRAALTRSVIELWVLEHRHEVEALNAQLGDIKGSDAPASVAYAAALIFGDISRELMTSFFHQLRHGGSGENHPITVLDKRLQRHRREGLRITNRDVLGLFIQAWNAWLEGRTLTKFQRPLGGSWSEETYPRPVNPYSIAALTKASVAA